MEKYHDFYSLVEYEEMKKKNNEESDKNESNVPRRY